MDRAIGHNGRGQGTPDRGLASDHLVEGTEAQPQAPLQVYPQEKSASHPRNFSSAATSGACIFIDGELKAADGACVMRFQPRKNTVRVKSMLAW